MLKFVSESWHLCSQVIEKVWRKRSKSEFKFFFINTNIVEQYYNRYPSCISLISVEKYFPPCPMEKLLDRCLALTELLSQVVFNNTFNNKRKKNKLQVKVQATLFQPFIRVLIFFLIHLHLFFNIKVEWAIKNLQSCTPDCTVISADTSSTQPKWIWKFVFKIIIATYF